MRRLVLAFAVMALGPLLACGGGGAADAGYVDSGISCTTSSQCPELRCLADGGQAPADAGGASMRACVFGRCSDSCS